MKDVDIALFATQTNKFEITYLPNQSKISGRENTCNVTENNKSSSSVLMYLGIAMFLIGIITALISFKRILKVNKPTNYQPKIEEKKMIQIDLYPNNLSQIKEKP